MVALKVGAGVDGDAGRVGVEGGVGEGEMPHGVVDVGADKVETAACGAAVGVAVEVGEGEVIEEEDDDENENGFVVANVC